MKQLYVSHNMLSIYSECPQKYKFHYVDGLAKLYRQEKPYLSFGESLHKALEEFFKIKNPEERTRARLMEILKNVWAKKGYTSEEEEKQYYQEAERLLGIFYDTEDLKAQPFRIEEFFRVPLGNFFLTGRIDRIDLIPGATDKLEIIDYKTGKFLPTQEEFDKDLQMSIYAIGVLKKYPRYYPEKISVYYFQHGQKLVTRRTPEDLRAAEEDIIQQVERMVSDTTFEPRESPFCKTCDYLLICPLMGVCAVASDSPACPANQPQVSSDKDTASTRGGGEEEKPAPTSTPMTVVELRESQKSLLEEELKKTREHYLKLTQDLLSLHNYSLDITSTLDPKILAGKISSAFRTLSGAERAAVFFWDQGEGKFVIQNHYNFDFADDFQIDEKDVFTFHEGCSKDVIAADTYPPSGDESKNTFCKILPQNTVTGKALLKNYILIPLVVNEKILGLVMLADIAGPRQPTNKHLKSLLVSLADQAGVAIYNASLYQYAIYDGLTRLFRGSHFQERLRSEMSRMSRLHTADNEKLTLIMSDLDGFKNINDTFGHVEGDRILREFSKVVKTRIRSTDIAGRYGGEEFAILLPSTDITGGVNLAEKIRSEVASTIRTSDGKPLTASFGVAEWDPSLKEPSDFVRKADEALYKAKQTGKNRVVKAG